MSTKDNGGPAFPAHHFDMAENEHGLTMRDYFAAKAMQAFISTYPCQAATDEFQVDYGSVAEDSYAMADEMLRARDAE